MLWEGLVGGGAPPTMPGADRPPPGFRDFLHSPDRGPNAQRRGGALPNQRPTPQGGRCPLLGQFRGPGIVFPWPRRFIGVENSPGWGQHTPFSLGVWVSGLTQCCLQETETKTRVYLCFVPGTPESHLWCFVIFVIIVILRDSLCYKKKRPVCPLEMLVHRRFWCSKAHEAVKIEKNRVPNGYFCPLSTAGVWYLFVIVAIQKHIHLSINTFQSRSHSIDIFCVLVLPCFQIYRVSLFATHTSSLQRGNKKKGCEQIRIHLSKTFKNSTLKELLSKKNHLLFSRFSGKLVFCADSWFFVARNKENPCKHLTLVHLQGKQKITVNNLR